MKSGEWKKGIVEEALPGLIFRVKLDEDREILAHLCGKMKMHHIKIVPGDNVMVELSKYDKNRGRIIRRI